MKKIRKGISILVFFILVIATSYTPSEAASGSSLFLKQLHFEVQINENGNMEVTETWNIHISRTNTLYKTFQTDATKYSNITNVKVVEVAEEGNQPFRQINQLMYHVTKNCYYGMKNKEGNFEIAWGVGLDNNTFDVKTYQISYTIEDAIAKYSDYAQLYWQFVGEDFEVNANRVTGTITLPNQVNRQEEIKVWGHTEGLNGEIYATDLNKVKFEVNNFKAGKYIEIRTLFPTQMIPFSTREENHPILDKVIKEETKWADKANRKREGKTSLNMAIVIPIIVVFVLIDIKLMVDVIKNEERLKRIKKRKPSENNIYYREIPREDSTPAQAVYLLKNAKAGLPTGEIGKIFSATLLDLSLKKIIDFQVSKEKRGKETITIRLLDQAAIQLLEGKEERVIASFLIRAFRSKSEITVKDLQRYIQNSASIIMPLQEKIKDGCKEDLERKKLINEEEEKIYQKITKAQSAYLLAFFSGLVFGIPMIQSTNIYMIIGILPFIVFNLINLVMVSISKLRISVLTQEGINEAEKWKGLKKYMEEFSLLEKREVPEMAIWERFLVYATAFGIADKVLKQLKIVYPNIENTVDRDTYRCMHLMTNTNFTRSFSNPIRNSLAASNSTMSSTYSSGIGGGGGFSGGGGGGRWPEVVEEADSLLANYDRKEKRMKPILEFIRNNSQKIKIITVAIVIMIILTIIIIAMIEDSKKQKYVVYNGQNIKESKYPGIQERIDELKEKHPNWKFTLFYTKLDWEELIEKEGHQEGTRYPLNLIPDSSRYPEDWKCEIDKDKTFDNGTWLCASDKAIQYQMDPRNILKEDEIFQFAELKYVENAQTKEGLEEITKDTFLAGEEMQESLLEAGKNANLDPYFVASRLIQEQGRKGTVLSRGYEWEGTIVYNPFNIRATRKFPRRNSSKCCSICL